MNLTECRNKIARDKGFKDWASFKRNYSFFPERHHTEAAKLFASEKVKEALQVAAEKAKTTWITDHPVELNHIGIDKQSILSLETELIENIKNDI